MTQCCPCGLTAGCEKCRPSFITYRPAAPPDDTQRAILAELQAIRGLLMPQEPEAEPPHPPPSTEEVKPRLLDEACDAIVSYIKARRPDADDVEVDAHFQAALSLLRAIRGGKPYHVAVEGRADHRWWPE